MNHNKREALAAAIASVMRSQDMVEKYLNLKVDDIHMMQSGVDEMIDEVYGGTPSESRKDCALSRGLEDLEALLNNLKAELSE